MRKWIVYSFVLIPILLVSCDRNRFTGFDDDMPPGTINNLMAVYLTDSTVRLSWTAPGDDGHKGTATSYTILHVTDSTFLSSDSGCVDYDNPPKPQLHGTTQYCEIAGLSPDTTYWFGIFTTDEAGNRSALSNVVSRIKIDPVQLHVELPWNYRRVADLVTIKISESGRVSPNQMWFYGDNQLIDSAIGPPWQVNWDIRHLLHGATPMIYAMAGIGGEERYSSDTIIVMVDSALISPAKPAYLRACNITDVGANLVWASSLENDFRRYQLEWHVAGASFDSSNSVILNDRFDTTYSIPDLKGLTEYQITLQVEDLFGNQSSIVSEIVTLDSIPPEIQIVRINRTSGFIAQLYFEPTSIHDFDYYEIVRSADAVESDDDLVVAIFSDPGAYSYYEQQYDFSIDNYYYVRIVDTQGFRSPGIPFLLPACLTGNWAIEFDGLNDLTVIPYVQEILGTDEFTLEMWVYSEHRSPESALFSQNDFMMEFLISDDFMSWGLAGQLMYFVHPLFPEKEWVHIVVTRDRGNYIEKLYINDERGIAKSCGLWTVFPGDLFLGCRKNLSCYFKGQIDEVRIWNRAFTQEDVLENYQKEIVGSPEGLVGYWSFNEGGGGVSYTDFGPPARLGLTGQVDASDPIWVLSTVPFVED